MNLVPVNALKSPRRLRERLEHEHELLVTNNGKPMHYGRAAARRRPGSPLRLPEARSRLALSAIRRAAAAAVRTG